MQISFLLKLYTCVSNLKNLPIEFVKFAIIEATKGGTSSLKRFLEKISWYRPWYQEIERQVKKNNGVITLPWQLRSQQNMDHNKFSSLCSTAVVTFFRYLY